MSEESLLASASPEARAVVALMQAAGIEKPAAWGNGQFLQWLIANAPAIIQMVKTIISMFGTAVVPTPAPTPTPGPTA
mgnify:CR=1 FL=1